MKQVKIPKIVGVLMLGAFILVIGYLFPYTLILGKQGLENLEVANTIDFYLKVFYGGLIGVFVIYFINYFWKSNNKLGDSIGFFNIGEKPSFRFFKKFSALQLTLLSFMLFSFIFLISHFLQLAGSLTGLKFLPQQFSPLDSLALSTAMIPTSENLLLAFTIGILILIFSFIAIYFKLSPKEYPFYSLAIVTLGSGIFGVIWHSTVYVGSDVALPVVFIFWAFMGFLAIATGLWTIPFLVHLLNNFFIDFTRIFANDLLLAGVVFVMVFLTAVLYYFLYKGRLFGSKSLEII